MPRRTPSPAIAQLMSEITPQEKQQTRVKMGLAARIGDLIGVRGMSKSEFAERMSKHPSEITKWLSGTHNFTIDTLVEIAYGLEIELEELFKAEHKQNVFFIETTTTSYLRIEKTHQHPMAKQA